MRYLAETLYLLTSLFLGIAIIAEYGYTEGDVYMRGLDIVTKPEVYHYTFIALGVFVIVLSFLVVAVIEGEMNRVQIPKDSIFDAKYIQEIKWWQSLLLFFVRYCYAFDYGTRQDRVYYATYKTLFGKVFLLDCGFIDRST